MPGSGSRVGGRGCPGASAGFCKLATDLGTAGAIAIDRQERVYVASAGRLSVLTGRIAEFDQEGGFVRMLLEPESWLPPHATGTPQGLAVDAQGTLYYADLDLIWKGLSPGPGPNGKVWRIRFKPDGTPRAPEIVLQGLGFPDGVAVLEGR